MFYSLACWRLLLQSLPQHDHMPGPYHSLAEYAPALGTSREATTVHCRFVVSAIWSWRSSVVTLDEHLLSIVTYGVPVINPCILPGLDCFLIRFKLQSYMEHCYLLKGEPQPFCVSCNETLTINHLLTNRAEFADSRRKHYSTNTLEEVLTSGNYAHILSFLKGINLYKKV